MTQLTPEILLRAYASGVFPMSEARDDPNVFWVDPQRRGILPLDGFHMSRSLARAMRKIDARVTLNRDFASVLSGCADRPDTWINSEIRAQYMALHRLGYAHSFEIFDGETLVGGMYGVALGGAFFGESMFSRANNASKIVLAVAIDHLRLCGFTLFDTQFLTDHLTRLGAIEISRAAYHTRLASALTAQPELGPDLPTLQDVVQRMTQTS